MSDRHRTTVVVGALEALTLVLLLLNLATVHAAPLAQLLGPVHGLLYLTGIALVWSSPYPIRRRWLALVPGVGTSLAARNPSAEEWRRR